MADSQKQLPDATPLTSVEIDIWLKGQLRERLGEDYSVFYQSLLETSFLNELAASAFTVDPTNITEDRRVEAFDLYELQSIICNKIAEGNETESYSAKIAKKGRLKVAEKFGEEAFELVTATIIKSKSYVVQEAADVVYHMLVLLISRDIRISDVLLELKKRTNISGIEEKRSRTY